MVADNGWTKVKKIIPGGKERYNSSLAAINAYMEHETCNIIFHDAARPLVTQRIINDVVAALRQHNAVSVTLPAVDTIVETNPTQRYIRRVPKRKFLQHAQTPQGFRWQTIAAAYIKALQDPELEATDDCGIMLKYLPKEKRFIVSGDARNIKLTYPEDIGMLTYLLKAAKK
jgi:2-C-methyl-D-erythritol 4-phosphate cytidylyltransferase